MAERLVRAGKRFASALRAEWTVAYVETPKLQRLPAARRDAILRVLRLAEQLGAETVTLSAATMSEAILDYCRKHNITKLLMGKPSRRGWKRWLLGSVVDTVIAEAQNINVYLLGSTRDGSRRAGKRTTDCSARRRRQGSATGATSHASRHTGTTSGPSRSRPGAPPSPPACSAASPWPTW